MTKSIATPPPASPASREAQEQRPPSARSRGKGRAGDDPEPWNGWDDGPLSLVRKGRESRGRVGLARDEIAAQQVRVSPGAARADHFNAVGPRREEREVSAAGFDRPTSDEPPPVVVDLNSARRGMRHDVAPVRHGDDPVRISHRPLERPRQAIVPWWRRPLRRAGPEFHPPRQLVPRAPWLLHKPRLNVAIDPARPIRLLGRPELAPHQVVLPQLCP